MPLLKFILIIFLYFLLLSSSPGLTEEAPIIIIGSGPSGIAAATYLLKNNFTNIKILEAENRIGGRINSVKFGDAYVDLGAEFCHGQEGNIVYSLAKDVVQHRNINNEFIRSNGEIIPEKNKTELLHFVDSFPTSPTAPEDCSDLKSVGDCLERRTNKKISENQYEKDKILAVVPWITSYLCSYDSPFDLHDLKITTIYKECGGDLLMHFNGLGYKTILEIMMQKFTNKDNNQLAIDDKILLEDAVKTIIDYDGDEDSSVIVTTESGKIFKADHVIFTPSLGVLKAKHQELFKPALPADKIDSINKIGFGAILKVFMYFKERWWPLENRMSFIWTLNDQLELKKENFTWLLNLYALVPAVNNPNVLIAWYAGKHVPEIENLPEEVLLEGHKRVLNTFCKPHYNVTMPDKLITFKWYSNPNFRGTYSYESLGEDNRTVLQQNLEKPLMNKNNKPTVLFAGDATHPYYFSTVHGAIESGYREAERLVNFYSKPCYSKI